MDLFDRFRTHARRREAFTFLRYLGPGLLVTVGFIDPGNWAANIAAGALHGYALLWVITLGTLILVFLQHNVAHLGIATGLCLSEATARYVRPAPARFILGTAVLASVFTALAEILGAAIGLRMLFPRLPLQGAAVLVMAFVLVMLFTNSYPKLEKWIIAFVSVIGLAFLYELVLVHVPWGKVAVSWIRPEFPPGSMLIIMSVLGAVVMPHNLFLHSEIIQSRQWNLADEKVIRRQLKFEFTDTLFSMGVGWAINSAMVIIAAAAFFGKAAITEIEQAHDMLGPLVGGTAAFVFAFALILAGLSSSMTAGMAGSTVFAAIFGETYDIKDLHSRIGAGLTLVAATAGIFLIGDPFKALLLSQMLLSVQLPITIITQIRLTSSSVVMGKYANSRPLRVVLWVVAAVVIALNLMLFRSIILSII
ncbi:MAG: Nramp family divalent metal transporter [Candidatus Aminicenantes bacterium]|nr:Nramp family divalent metal transporter [Candidatus Aminicenantes bacterium]